MFNPYQARTSENQDKNVLEQGSNTKGKHDVIGPSSFMTAQMMYAQQGVGNKALQQYMSSMYKEDEAGEKQNEQEQEKEQQQQAGLGSSSNPEDNEEQDDAILENMVSALSFLEILAMPPAPKKRTTKAMLRDVRLCELTLEKALATYNSIDEIEKFFPQLIERFSLTHIELKDMDTPEAHILIKINPSRKVDYGKHMTRDSLKRLTLKKKIRYKTPNNMRYKTDSKGRIHSVSGELKLGTGKRNSYAQSNAGREDRLADDEGGHLIATVFEGSGGLDNLVPMNGNLNKGRYKAMENLWRKHLKLGDNVSVRINVTYLSGRIRPKRFNIAYSINNIETKVELNNKPGGV